jgi:hypothetical protein
VNGRLTDHGEDRTWPAVVQMAALSLRGTTDLARLARELEVGGQDTADYFVSEVLENSRLSSARPSAAPRRRRHGGRQIPRRSHSQNEPRPSFGVELPGVVHL